MDTDINTILTKTGSGVQSKSGSNVADGGNET